MMTLLLAIFGIGLYMGILTGIASSYLITSLLDFLEKHLSPLNHQA